MEHWIRWRQTINNRCCAKDKEGNVSRVPLFRIPLEAGFKKRNFKRDLIYGCPIEVPLYGIPYSGTFGHDDFTLLGSYFSA